MAYQLQPNLIRVENPAVPPECADENVFCILSRLTSTIAAVPTQCFTAPHPTWPVRVLPMN